MGCGRSKDDDINLDLPPPEQAVDQKTNMVTIDTASKTDLSTTSNVFGSMRPEPPPVKESTASYAPPPVEPKPKEAGKGKFQQFTLNFV